MREELRLALVMNGGVSLAVWMGGATAEIWRLVTARTSDQHPVYQRLLALTDAEARVDVISGTSAGGINGAALALALVHDTDFMELRQVWTEIGDFQALLRSPMDTQNPGSILKGDDYFLPEVQAAFEKLAGPQKAVKHSTEALPLDLKLTATMLSGAQGRNVDDLGADLHDVDYRAYFHFCRKGPQDDFHGPEAVKRLARAARSTASFPFAFEPSRVGPTSESHLRTYRHDAMKQTRFVVDGGILDNKPFRGARDAIFDMPHRTRVRRVMAYINPDPGDGPPFDFGEKQEAPMPAMSSVIAAAVMGIPTSQTIADQLMEIRRHNDEVRARRSNVQTLAISLAGQPSKLLDLAEQLYRSYRERRLSTTFELFIFEPLTLAASRDARYAETMKRFGRNTRDAMRRQFASNEGRGWLPAGFKRNDPVGGEWTWGMFPIEFSITVAMNLLRLVQSVNEKHFKVGMAVGREWDELFECVRTIQAQRAKETEAWRAIVRKHLDALVAEEEEGTRKQSPQEQVRAILVWHQGLFEELFDITRAPGRQAVCKDLGQRVATVCRSASKHADMLWQESHDGSNSSRSEDLAELNAMWDLSRMLTAPTPGLDPGVDGTLSVLMALEVVEFAFTDHQEMCSDTLIELVQISGNDASPLGGRHAAADKLRGIQVAHFGAFYKRSWRANDWTYGRLDCSSRVVDILLSPARLFNQYKDEPEKVFDELKKLALALDDESKGASEQLREQLKADWETEGCDAELQAELAFLRSNADHMPDALPRCARALRRRLHYEIAMQEMGHIATAVEADQSNGALASGPGHTLMCRLHRIRAIADVDRGFVQSMLGQFQQQDPTVRSSPAAARDLIGSGLLAKESFHTEVGSDLMTQTFAHTMATTQSTLAGKSAQLGAVATFFRALHLPVFAFYMAAISLAKQSATAAAVIALLLGVGITLVTVSVASKDLPDTIATIGWAALCAGVLMACAASKRTAVWILVPLVLGMGFIVANTDNAPLWIWVTVLIMVLALMNRLQFPVALVAIVCAGVFSSGSSPKRLIDAPAAVLTLVVVIALVVAYRHGTTRRRRDWRSVVMEALRTPEPSRAWSTAVASLGIASLVANILPLDGWVLNVAMASGSYQPVFDGPSLALVQVLAFGAYCAVVALLVWLVLRRFKIMDQVPQKYRAVRLFGIGLGLVVLCSIGAALEITVPIGNARFALSVLLPFLLFPALALLVVAVVRVCVGYGRGA